MKNMLLSLFTCLLLAVAAQAQQAKGQLDIQLNKNILQPGDSLFIKVDYKDGGGQILNQSLATLELMVENEEGLRTRLRWPVINGQASGALYLPDSLPRGKYTLLAGLQQRFFEVIGEIKDDRNSGSIQAMLLTKTGEWAEQEVPVAPDGTFAIRNWLFEDNALLAFSGTQNNNQPLNIRISTQLDSSYAPLAVAGRAFYIGNPPSAVRQTLNQPVEISNAAFADQGSVLPAVLVRTTAKSPAQQFNEEHARGLFRAGDERMLSIMTDPSALSFPNIFSYLQGRVAGLQIALTGFNGGVARWRGGPVTFFLDEMRVSAQQIANIPMTDIAIVKAYPPPFIGAPGGGAGIAIYTRRGGEANYLPANRQVFRVRGYTPAAAALNMSKLSL
ncbi:MAG: hypothetical protein JWR18_1646 [Segetibacter sp.]|nr:hypothetical protein [Segetibacter sp.]